MAKKPKNRRENDHGPRGETNAAGRLATTDLATQMADDSEALLDLIRAGRGVNRALEELAIPIASFKARYAADETFRELVIAAYHSMDESVREVLYLSALAGDYSSIQLFLQLSYWDVEHAIRLERHRRDMTISEPAPADLGVVIKACTILAGKVASIVPADRQQDLLRFVNETIAETGKGLDLGHRSPHQESFPVPHWLDRSSFEDEELAC